MRELASGPEHQRIHQTQRHRCSGDRWTTHPNSLHTPTHRAHLRVCVCVCLSSKAFPYWNRKSEWEIWLQKACLVRTQANRWPQSW